LIIEGRYVENVEAKLVLIRVQTFKLENGSLGLVDAATVRPPLTASLTHSLISIDSINSPSNNHWTIIICMNFLLDEK